MLGACWGQWMQQSHEWVCIWNPCPSQTLPKLLDVYLSCTCHWQDNQFRVPSTLWKPLLIASARCRIILVSASSWLQGANDWCLVGDAHNLWCHFDLNEGLHPTTIFKPVSSSSTQYAILQWWWQNDHASSHCFSISLSSGIWARMWLLSSVLSECTCFSIPS